MDTGATEINNTEINTAADGLLTGAADNSTGNKRAVLFMWLALILFYLVSVGVRYLLTLKFSVSPCIMPDEGLYANLARALYDGDILSMRGQPITYNNILYPYLFSFFYSLPPTIDLFRTVQFLNCAMMCLAVFPTYFIARRFIKSNILILAVCLGSLIVPDFVMAERAMTEALVYPLFLFTALIMFRGLEDGQKGYGRTIAAGIAAFVMYLGKSGAWGLIIAYGTMLLFIYLRSKNNNPENSEAAMLKRSVLSYFRSKDSVWLKRLLVYIVTFAAAFGLMRLYMKYGLGVDYGLETVYQDQTGSVSWRQIGSTLIGIGIYIFYTVIAFAVFPLLIPLSGLKKYSEEKQRMILFSTVTLVMFIIGIAYIIYAGEGTSVGFSGRIHTRYLFPFLPLFWSFALDKSVSGIRLSTPMKLLLLSAAVILLVDGFASMVSSRPYPVDAIHLSHISYDFDFARIFGPIITCKRIWQVLYLALMGGGFILIWDKGWKKAAGILMGCFIAVTLLLANYTGYDTNQHNMDSELRDDVIELSQMLYGLEDVLLLGGDMKYFDNHLGVLDVALRQEPYYAHLEDFVQGFGDAGAIQPFIPPVYWTESGTSEIPVPSKIVMAHYSVFKVQIAEGCLVEKTKNERFTVITPNENGQVFNSCVTDVRTFVPTAAATLWCFDVAVLAKGTVQISLYTEGLGHYTVKYGEQSQTLQGNSVNGHWLSANFNIPAGTTAAKFSIEDCTEDIKITHHLVR